MLWPRDPSGSIGSAGSSSPTDGRQRPLAAVRPYSDTDSGHNSVVSSNYDSHSGSSVGSAGSPPTGKRASVTDDDTTATATATAAATTTTTTITQDNNNTSERQIWGHSVRLFIFTLYLFVFYEKKKILVLFYFILMDFVLIIILLRQF